MFVVTLENAQVLGYVLEKISDRRSGQEQDWHRLDLRDADSGAHLYVSLPGSDKDLIKQAQGLPMGSIVSVRAELDASVTPTGAQKLKLRAQSVSVASAAKAA